MGLSTRIRLTVIIIVGAFAFDLCRATATTTAAAATIEVDKIKQNDESVKQGESTFSSSLDSPVSVLFSSTPPYSEGEVGTGSMNEEIMLSESPETRLMPDSDESGILLPYEDDFPHSGGKGRLLSGNVDTEQLPQAVSFPGKPISLRVSSGKAIEQPGNEDEAATYYIRNNCFGPRCNRQHRQQNSDKIPLNSPEEWKNMFYNSKEIKSKKYDDGGGRNNHFNIASHKLEENVLESMSSNFHSQVAIPFVVVDDNPMKGLSQSTFSRRNGVPDRFSRLTASTNVPSTTEGWVKLKAISPEAYDPFRFSRNQSGSTQSTFSKRDSSQQSSNNFSKRVGVELNPESFADRWGGWGSNNNNNNDDNRGGSRLPAWLEEQLKYGNGNRNGNRNSDQGKNWVKLDPIPVAGVTISKWVPKGTSSQELPTTTWQNNRDRPNGGSQWWDRIDDNRILSGNRPSSPFLRPNGNGNSGNNNRFNDGGGWGDMGGSKGGGAGSPLSSFDRYPTNSWNDIIYPEGPTSATVSWQQNKNKGISNYPSSFGSGGGGGGGGGESSGGWSSGSDTRKPIVATGSWSAPPSNNRFPSFINRFNEHRPSNYPVKQASEDDPRWVLISNTRRVTGGSSGNRGNDFDRSKVLSYINRLHPDHDRQVDFPYYERAPTSHRHGKDFWPFPNLGPPSTDERLSKDEAFLRLNATLSTLNPILLHRSGTTVRPPVVGTLSPSSPEFAEILGLHEGSSNSDSDSDTDFINSISSTLSPLLSTYIGDGRGTSSNAASLYQSSTSTPVRNIIPSRIRQGLKNINPVYAAVGAGMIPATLAAVMPMMLGRRKRRDVTNLISHPHPKFKYYYANTKTGFLSELRCCKISQY